VYAPSLHSYFEEFPKRWINDLFTDNAVVKDVMIDMTKAIPPSSTFPSGKIGKLWVSFSNPQREEVMKLEGSFAGGSRVSLEFLRKFIRFRDDIIDEYDLDYVILDTSPGIRYWSINSLAVADVLLLTLKYGDQDIQGTKRIASDIFKKFTNLGAESYLLLNRVSGYCVPHTLITHSHIADRRAEGAFTESEVDGTDIGESISKEASMELLSAIPCYCDIQFSRKEFLTALRNPDHPFAKQIEKMTRSKPFEA
jgi:chromosome partitioning protein